MSKRKGLLKAPSANTNLQLVYTGKDIQSNAPDYYVLEQTGEEGFIIASADERTVPIVTYSDAGTFNRDSLPCCFLSLLDNFQKQVTYAREKNTPRYQYSLPQEIDYASIEPITNIYWHQV